MRLIPVVVLMALAAPFPAEAGELSSSQFVAELDGTQVISGPGAADGSGFAIFDIDGTTGSVCHTVVLTGVGIEAETRVHRGAAGASGPALFAFPDPGDDGYGTGCVTVDPLVAQTMIDDPMAYYLSVTTPALPEGAVRGQLTEAEICVLRASTADSPPSVTMTASVGETVVLAGIFPPEGTATTSSVHDGIDSGVRHEVATDTGGYYSASIAYTAGQEGVWVFTVANLQRPACAGSVTITVQSTAATPVPNPAASPGPTPHDGLPNTATPNPATSIPLAD